jgi:hypothetical protein
MTNQQQKPENGKASNPNAPPDKKVADKATADNDLTTGHSDDDDGGDDNAKK